MSEIQSAPTELMTWNESVNEQTTQLAYEEATRLQTFYATWADSLDGKTVAVFSVGSAIFGLTPLFRNYPPQGGAFYVWIAAGICWIIAAILCHDAYTPRALRVDPDPKRLCTSEWLRLPPDEYRFYRLRDLGKTHEQNRDVLDEKAWSLRFAMWFTAGEVLLLAVAFVLSRG
jgi:hypothetical protein